MGRNSESTRTNEPRATDRTLSHPCRSAGEVMDATSAGRCRPFRCDGRCPVRVRTDPRSESWRREGGADQRSADEIRPRPTPTVGRPARLRRASRIIASRWVWSEAPLLIPFRINRCRLLSCLVPGARCPVPGARCPAPRRNTPRFGDPNDDSVPLS